MCERTVVFTQGRGDSDHDWHRCVMEGGEVVGGSECVFESSTPCSRVLSYAFAHQAEATLGGPVEGTIEDIEGLTRFTFRRRTDEGYDNEVPGSVADRKAIWWALWTPIAFVTWATSVVRGIVAGVSPFGNGSSD